MSRSMTKDERRWRYALATLATAYGLLCILPNILQRLDLVFPFAGIEMLGGDQEVYYAARVREVLDGNMMVGNVYNSDKSLPYAQPPLPEWLMGGVGLVLGLDVGATLLVGKWLFGTLLFLTMGGFLASLSRRPWWSLAATASVLCAWFLFASPSALWDALRGAPLSSEFLRFARLTNPQVSLTLFFASLWGMVVWMTNRRLMALLLTGVLTGASFYAYPYTWSYLLTTGGVLTLLACIRRDWRLARGLVAIGVIAAIVATPYGIHQSIVVNHPAYAGLLERFGLVHTRAPIWGVWLTALLAIGCFAPKRIGRQWILVTALAWAGAIVMNQQLLTGVTIVPHHYHWYFIHPLAVAFVILWAGPLAQERIRHHLPHRTRGLLTAIILLMCFAWGVKLQVDSYRAQREQWGEAQRAAGVLAFLDSPALREQTVYVQDELQELTSVFSRANTLYANNITIGCLCSQEWLRDILFFELWLQGLTPADAEKRFATDLRGLLSARVHAIYYRESAGGYDRLPDTEVQERIREYRDYVALPLAAKRALHPMDAILLPVGSQRTPALRAMMQGGVLVYEDDVYRLWRLPPVHGRS
ncbi:MAG: hypothetical protein G01um101425_102 [Candidatus Peregrinibacteria bacterium Gr01-1014_25]|nr:MAG: hypothetical protein G01um101425_102 [Candidatus Peregrinibacteria bacterium Gr01-1014_25]